MSTQNCTDTFQLCHPDHNTFPSAPSIALLFMASRACNLPSLSSPLCPPCPKSHPKFRAAFPSSCCMAQSPSTIILNMHIFMCPFSFGRVSPKTTTKAFQFFLGFSFSLVLKQVQTVGGRQAERGHCHNFSVSICSLFTTYTALWDTNCFYFCL